MTDCPITLRDRLAGNLAADMRIAAFEAAWLAATPAERRAYLDGLSPSTDPLDVAIEVELRRRVDL